MSVPLNLESSENWEQRLAQSFVTTPENLLPEYAPNFEFNSNIIAVLVDNSEALDTWYSAGWISQRINLPFGSTAASSVNATRLRLREKQLLIFPKLTATYKISVRFPRWFTQASITIWEYTSLQAENMENQLSEIQGKLDTLLQRHPP
ncbi:MAG: hypothetical protein JGK38_23935 [Microcoleus sp. PH2017_15_JOR_U_A]|uniref:hypothetical protein n=1 Tax=unclassified Microcoleus TaxID=2642155 RepID=UPI001D74694A|nr:MULTISPECIES: hypothetical protein [unclassified Microcoleus]MCC3473310.1 hypothetical protein [Microcoleus sp. PH2017_13_LAR_U_A]MCC3486524.1 hypothetical protein [Microcoleus sp. PH2017_14_LAR_D_A]MCC3499608.1 hypothetical protein [Microcoleus sp. PH2017_15_JOR_U_A]MCC3600179.1 hypothetical protein [Microcoleus sp. PH2017_26_ELK_O_A]MCC3623166.1 hypothetical protein [Microcoleus sp. PH2017_36_ELK_O_B]